jgi:tetratricopeptide (TPR) repeat protein
MKKCAQLMLFVMLLCGSPAARAQQISPTTPPPPPPSEPAFDPYHAAKSLEVGTFYLKKGRVDAAIDRFQEAAQYEPGLAEPWKLLGEAYAKKRNYALSVSAYNKYLQIFPSAPDAPKVRKVVARLQKKLAPSEAAKH